MPRRLIAVSSALSLAACVAAPDNALDPVLDKATSAPAEIGTTQMRDPQATSADQGEVEQYPSITSLFFGEEEDGSGTVVSTMALGEEDGQWPQTTTLALGEEEDGSGTMIEDQLLDPSELFGLRVESNGPHQFASIADIMARLRHSKG